MAILIDMATTLYMITDDHGNCMSDGLTMPGARLIAQSAANRLKKRVWLTERDESESEPEAYEPAVSQ